jgi:hypothetical protein
VFVRAGAVLYRLAGWLYRISTFWTLAAAITCYAFLLATVMPAQSAASRQYGGDWGAPDRHLFYTPDEIYAAVATWGDAGRQDYIAFRLGLDIAWAMAYTAFLVTAIGCVSRRTFGANEGRRLLILLPLVTMLLDYAENALGIFLVSAVPQRYDLVAGLATLATALKWLTLVAAHGALAYALVVALRGWQRRRAV